MKYKFIWIALLVALCLSIFSSCKKKASIVETRTSSDAETMVQASEESVGTASPDESCSYSPTTDTTVQYTDIAPVTMESTVSYSSTADTTVQYTDIAPVTIGSTVSDNETEPSKPTLIWAYIDVMPVNDRAKELIAQVLEEKGIECNIEYVTTSILDVDSYPSWVKNQRESGQVLDILHTSFWHHGAYDFSDFAQDELLPLNDYLESDEGKEFREAYSEAEWRRASFGETIYTPPFRSGEGELYYFVNNKYIEDFEAIFDGSYQSLKRILEKNSEFEPVIGAANVGDDIGTIWLGYERNGLETYENKTGRIVDITRQPKAKEMLQLIYSDIQRGELVINPNPELIKKELLVYVARRFKPEMEGYTAYRMSPNHNHSGFDFFGISKYSSQKELALQVLAAVYCDPRIASLINFKREDPEGWVSQAEYLKNSLQISPVMGFVADLSLEQREALVDYYLTIYPLFYTMINISGGKSEINQSYLKQLDAVFDAPKNYGDLFDVINSQLDEWLKKHKE